MKRPFTKPAKTYQEQVSLLKQRGLIISDDLAAENALKHIQYYRLGAYWLPFESNHQTHMFQPNTSLDQVIALYQFDRQLRLLVLDAIERIEVSVKSQWAYHMAHLHSAHAHLDPNIASRVDRYQKNLQSLTSEVDRSDETFIKHLKNTYSESLPPIWAVCEVMSLGLLSHWYSNLQPLHTRSAISSQYFLDERTMQSWLHHLCHVRNICAHHSRLWNREFTITPQLPRNKPSGLKAQFHQNSRHLYNSLVIILHFMDVIEPKHLWRGRLLSLLHQYSIPLSHMDFPLDWQKFDIWQNQP